MIIIRGKKVLISLGGTFEPLDSVRGITNRSSGKMGLALAKQAYILGADVTLIAAHVSVDISPLFNVIHVETSKEMAKVTFDLVKDFDIFISTAAISDFEVVGRKNKKISSDSSLSISLKPTIKIIRNIKKINPDTCGWIKVNGIESRLMMRELILLLQMMFPTKTVTLGLI